MPRLNSADAHASQRRFEIAGCRPDVFANKMTSLPGIRRNAGFGMLEVLISLLIILLGLLGLAGLIVRSNQAEMESYQRVQAVTLLQDMVDRINANRKVATCYSNGGVGMTLTGAAVTPTCATGTAPQQARAIADLTGWNSLISGSAEVSGGSNVGAMIGAIGCINQIDAANNIYIVSIAWQGLATTAAPGNTCGSGQFGDERQRRVVTATLRIGALL